MIHVKFIPFTLQSARDAARIADLETSLQQAAQKSGNEEVAAGNFIDKFSIRLIL